MNCRTTPFLLLVGAGCSVNSYNPPETWSSRWSFSMELPDGTKVSTSEESYDDTAESRDRRGVWALSEPGCLEGWYVNLTTDNATTPLTLGAALTIDGPVQPDANANASGAIAMWQPVRGEEGYYIEAESVELLERQPGLMRWRAMEARKCSTSGCQALSGEVSMEVERLDADRWLYDLHGAPAGPSGWTTRDSGESVCTLL